MARPKPEVVGSALIYRLYAALKRRSSTVLLASSLKGWSPFALVRIGRFPRFLQLRAYAAGAPGSHPFTKEAKGWATASAAEAALRLRRLRHD